MKKGLILFLITLLLLSLIACNQISPDPSPNKPEIDKIYSSLSSFKGLELYVWANNETGTIYCGLLDGTNRIKMETDFKLLYANPATLDRMATILGTYDKDTYVTVMAIGEGRNELTTELVTKIKTQLDKTKMPNIQYLTK
jgi:hypothetical protein